MPINDDITPKVLLEHMQNMQRVLGGKIDQNRLELKADIQRVERKVDILKVGVDNIDKRLDAIEIENLPKRVAVLEAAVQ